MQNLTKFFAALIVTALFCVIQFVLNVKKTRRARQAVMPVLALAVEIAGTIVVLRHFKWVSLIALLSDYLENSEIAIINLLLMVGFILLKLVICPIVSAVFKNNKLVRLTSSAFYDYDSEYNEWFLMPKWIVLRELFFVLLCGLTFISGCFISLTWLLGKGSFLWFAACPCAVVVVVCEIYNFLNGQTKEEYHNSIYGESSASEKVGGYYKMREVYEQLLSSALLAAHTGYEYIGKRSAYTLLEKMNGSVSHADNLTESYFTTSCRDIHPDADYVEATRRLMNGENVVVLNPFYRDIGVYITLPIVNALLSGKKCVVISGRMAVCDDVINWLAELLKDYTHLKSFWTVSLLNTSLPECDIGIINFAQLYDKDVLSANRAFLGEVGIALLLEPSVILNTGQVALSIIAGQMAANGNRPVYCVSDRNVDGLVDTLSHVLRTDITNVIAPPIAHCVYSGITWDADGDFKRQQLFNKQTKYLGNGVEIAAIAIKNQVRKASWYSNTKSPIRDIRWIAGQYYPTVCRYMNVPSQQNNLYEKIEFSENIWCAEMQDESFIIVEDEFCNMFNSLRTYISRGTRQAFVNVLSENYLLRDYMRCNREMFLSNPDAIPSIVPDYAKTERNTLIKLILTMAYRPVTESEILDELRLTGIESSDVFGTLSGLIRKYTFADGSVFDVRTVKQNICDFVTISACVYGINSAAFSACFADTLKCAYFVIEDEIFDQSYIDAKLFGQVTQLILPGQYVTYDGKYYVVKYVSASNGIVLRRASDLFDKRRYYRQVRTYTFGDHAEDEIITLKTVTDIEIAYVRKNFEVKTTGYLEMNDNHDLRLARHVDFSEDPNVESYVRRYKNKAILRIKLPDTTDRIRYSLCLLLSEVFRSVFPDCWQYLAAVTKCPDDVGGVLNFLVYPAQGDVEDEYIYIVEDSDIDLGLIEAVDRNLMTLMEIIADFLEWHFEKMREPAAKDPVPAEIALPEEQKKRSLFVRMADRIRKLFRGRKEKELKLDDDADKHPDSASSVPADDEPLSETVPTTEYTLDDVSRKIDRESDITPDSTPIDLERSDTEQTEMPKPAAFDIDPDEFDPDDTEDPDIVHVDGTDIFDTDGMPEDDEMLEYNFAALGLIPITKTRYQRECYLKFGFDEIDGRLKIEEVRNYLRVRGWGNNNFAKARKRTEKANIILDAVNHCDFCSVPLTGVSFERMNDGRIRCNDCSNTALVTVEEFSDLFKHTFEMMKSFFAIDFKASVSVRVSDADTVAKGAGSVFRPSTEYASRVLGYAQRKHGKYSIHIENGSPRLAAINTLVHEMTHIWQYLNWDRTQIASVYGTGQNRDLVFEGMAMWVSIQYLYQIGETYYATQQEFTAESRDDIYGVGFRLFRDKYPFVKDSSIIKHSPFLTFPPL